MIKLVLVRHGESQWNLENRFTGWTDVDLSEKGVMEAKEAGLILKKNNFTFDLAYTSSLKRAQRTLSYILDCLHLEDIEIIKDYHLNERHYGALQGLNKAETAEKYGQEQVQLWRRSADTRPPALTLDDPRHPRFDSNFKDVPVSELPATENLVDTLERVLKIWNSSIKPELLKKRKIIIAAHGNSLRAIVMHLKGLTKEEVVSLNIPTGKPYVFEFDDELNFQKDYYLEK